MDENGLIAAAQARRAAKDASGVIYVDGSIYECMEACLVRSGRTVAHVVKYADAVEIASLFAITAIERAALSPAMDYKAAWEALNEPLSWMQDSKQLGAYWGWNLADIANDLIDRAYPGIRSGDAGGNSATQASAVDAAPQSPLVDGMLALRAIKAVTATTKDGVAGLSRIMAITIAAGVKQPYHELLSDAEVRLIVERPRTEWAHLFKPGVAGCAIPPDGWRCTRDRGHSGPCAAIATSDPPATQTREAEEAETVAMLSGAVRRILARCEAVEDENSDQLGKDQTEASSGFLRGERSLAKSIRRELHDLTRAALSAGGAK